MSAALATPLPHPTFAVEKLPDGALRVNLSGAWHFAALEPGLPGLNRSLFYLAAVPDIQWDLHQVETLDVTGAAVLWGHWKRRLDRVRLRPEHEALFEQLARTPPPGPAPTDDMKPAMLGSCWTIAATARWCRTMDSNDVPSAVSVVPWIWPMSSLGMKPLGTRVQSATVPSRITAEKPSAVRRWFITHVSVRW